MLTRTELLLPYPHSPRLSSQSSHSPAPGACAGPRGDTGTLHWRAQLAMLPRVLQPPATVMLHRTALLEHLCSTKTPFHHIALKRAQQISFLRLKATCAAQQRIQIQVQPFSFLSTNSQEIYKAQLGKVGEEINFPASPPSVPSHLHIRL